MTSTCTIIPESVLKRFADDTELSAEVRQHFQNALTIDAHMRILRQAAAQLTLEAVRTNQLAGFAPTAVAAAPAITVFDCKHSTALPGSQIANPASSQDATAKRTFTETTAVAQFYQTLFGRNSIDGAGMTLMSSVHYGVRYNNAFWNGSQMTYGDGDDSVFVDFTLGNDVIGHELTHGVTQHTLGLVYANEPGGLNESISDVFGSMFRQWQAHQDVKQADWLIGHNILGPAAKQRGFTCLRDMANPDAPHCLAPQVKHFSQYHGGMDPHISSGIANLAFHKIALSVGGYSWDKVGKLWYSVLTGAVGRAPRPNMHMRDFAHDTRAAAKKLFPGDAGLAAAVNAGWSAVGL